MVIGVSGLDRLACSRCGAILDWVEEGNGVVKLDKDGVLIPAYEDKLDISRATQKTAICCGLIHKADPWPSFIISTRPED
jgi:hypothetical protein